MRDLKSVTTTMGCSSLDGLMMGTRRMDRRRPRLGRDRGSLIRQTIGHDEW